MIVQRSWFSLRYLLLLCLDAGIAVACLVFALLLRFNGTIEQPYADELLRFATTLIASRLLANVLLRLHRWSFRFSGLTDGTRVAIAGVLGTGMFLGGLFLLKAPFPPRSVVVLEMLLTTFAMATLRFAPRLAWTYQADRRRGRHHGALRTLIVGAGAAGEMLRRDLARSDEHNYRVVAFVDDDPGKWGAIIGGVPVLGPIAELRTLVGTYRIAKVLIAIPRLPAARVREILELCADLNVHFKILPVSYVYLQERVSASMLQDLSPDDLLPRDAVSFSDSGEASPALGRTVLVTGAAGSIGSEICVQLAAGRAGRVVMVDINENGLYLLQRRLERERPGVAVAAEVADIRDHGRMRSLFETYRPHDVFHAAAHKHVPLMEAAPAEAVKNNILPTRDLAAAADACGVERFVFISTDKAVRPTSVMGASKRVGEMIVRSLAPRSRTRFCAVRFGNVLGSAGSVVPLFREQIAAGGPVTVTHPEVRRYFMTISEAVGLVLKAGYGNHGPLCVLDMGEQIRIVDLARHLVTMAGLVPGVDVRIEFTGLRPGEKLFEELLTEDEERTFRVSHKIMAANSPAPPHDLGARLEALGRAAAANNHAAVVTLLRALVPSFQEADRALPPPAEEQPPEEPAAQVM